MAWSRCSAIRKRAAQRGCRTKGIVELIAFPAGLLIMLGLFTRPIGLVAGGALSGPVLRRPASARAVHAPQRRRSDPAERFFFLTWRPPAAARGVWILDDKRDARRGRRMRWVSCASPPGVCSSCTASRNSSRVGGGRIERDIMTMRGLAGWLERSAGRS